MIVMGVYGSYDWDGNVNVPLDSGDPNIWVHDAAVSLWIDGEHACSIQQERLTRQKGDGSYPLEAINYCLDAAGIEGKDVDLVAVPTQCTMISYEHWFNGQTVNKLSETFPNASYFQVGHHLCHASASVFVSGQRKGSFLTLDGTGGQIMTQNGPVNYETHSIGYFDLDKKRLRIFCGPGPINNFGGMYYGASEMIYRKKVGALENPEISSQNSKYRDTFAGKVMGLSAYGSDYEYGSNDTDYWWNPSEKLASENYPYVDFARSMNGWREQDADRLAYILQRNYEEAIIYLTRTLLEKDYLEENVCFSGGSFMNIIGNTLVRQEAGFKEIFHTPFATDCGLAIGAACYAIFRHDKDVEIKLPENIGLLGKEYTDDEIATAIKESGLKCKKFDNDQDLCDYTAKILSDTNKVVGWFQGKSEFGPRALGSRSILMHPGPAENKDILNARVKHREYWRPFAGIVTDEAFNDYFEEDFPSPYMMYNLTVREEKRKEIAAITHIDNSCRAQTVNEKNNPKVHMLIKSFEKLTGVSMVLNTSFNDNGEPIVESPTDALTSFKNMNMDLLIIGNYAVLK